MRIPKPKLRELKEAVCAVFSPRFTTKFPALPCEVPEKYRGKPEFDTDKCIGCGACVLVCPTQALTMEDDIEADPPMRRIYKRHDTCIFCANCHDNCTTNDGINLTREWDLAALDRESMKETFEFELQVCEKCSTVIGTKKHLSWLYEKLGPLAYTNPSLIIAKSLERKTTGKQHKVIELVPIPDADRKDVVTSDFMKILCPTCKYELNIRL